MLSLAADHQKILDAHFRTAAGYWKQIYSLDDVNAAIHRYRFEQVLTFFDRLALPKTARVLEIGCGAGLTTVALAGEGYRVDALDTVPAMIDATRALARKACVASRVQTSLADVHELPVAGNTYDAVLTIGVLPWLPAIERPLAEMSRVLRPGGALIANIDNKWCLHRFLDPRLNPLVQPLKQALCDALCRAGLREPEAYARTMSRGGFDRRLRQAGFTQMASATLGFGPFTVLGREALGERLGARLNHRIQEWADGGVPVIRWTGSQYLVAARRGI